MKIWVSVRIRGFLRMEYSGLCSGVEINRDCRHRSSGFYILVLWKYCRRASLGSKGRTLPDGSVVYSVQVAIPVEARSGRSTMDTWRDGVVLCPWLYLGAYWCCPFRCEFSSSAKHRGYGRMQCQCMTFECLWIIGPLSSMEGMPCEIGARRLLCRSQCHGRGRILR